MVTSAEARENRLLAALPEDELRRWLPQLEWADLPLGQVLYEPGRSLSHVWFPTTAVVCLLCATRDGDSAEIAVVGNEGMVGAPLFLGPSHAAVYCAGRGLRMMADPIKDEFDRNGPALRVLLRYGQALITQIAQTAVCNRHHRLDQQLCRWLLMSLDRLRGSELVMTQDHIAQMLGVRRVGVTERAFELQRLGLIRYARGHIRVLDRSGLEERACECYRVVRNEYKRLLPGGGRRAIVTAEAAASAA